MTAPKISDDNGGIISFLCNAPTHFKRNGLLDIN